MYIRARCCFFSVGLVWCDLLVGDTLRVDAPIMPLYIKAVSSREICIITQCIIERARVPGVLTSPYKLATQPPRTTRALSLTIIAGGFCPREHKKVHRFVSVRALGKKPGKMYTGIFYSALYREIPHPLYLLLWGRYVFCILDASITLNTSSELKWYRISFF